MGKYQKVPMAHLHMHSSFSELDAISKIPDIVQRAVEFGWDSMCLTDHGTIAGCVEFHSECLKRNIKPIMGCEFYFVPDAQKAREEKKRGKHHLILMAMDNEGWTNIKKLTTKANEKFYYSPTIDYKDLEEHGNGLIVLSACLKNVIAQNIIDENYDVAFDHAKKFKKMFGDRFYLELQDGGLDVQIRVNEVLRRFGEKLDLNLVATQDSHYLEPKDVESHEAIWAIRTGHTFDVPVGRYESGGGHNHNECRPYYSTKEYWLKDGHHMLNEELTTEKGERRKTTLRQKEVECSASIADRVKIVDIGKGMHLPSYEFIPDSIEVITNIGYLRSLVYDGFKVIYHREADGEHKDRLEKELLDIEDAKLADYFLIVFDIVRWARNEKIPIGPGRGSAAGSLVSFCLGITEVDPIKYGLIWERFYNAGRKGSLADIDLDFSKRDRDKVIAYIKERFGDDRVAQMVTFNTLAPRAALKDTAKLLGSKGMSFEDANVMTRYVHKKAKSIADALERSDKLKEYAERNPQLFRIAQMLEGCPKSRGRHAAGVIISNKPFSEGFPLRWDTREKTLITEWDGVTLEGLGYLKMDILGLKTLDVLRDVEETVNGAGQS